MGLEHWESYYRSGHLVSCPVGPEAGYTLELREAWVEFFSPLADGARVVDIATGNGAVALLAKDAAAALRRCFEIHGVDLAQIDPPRHVSNGRSLFGDIRFHAGVAAESLPFEAGSVDALGGQYALEYTDIPRTLAEAFRVIKPGGRCQFILHHRDSIIVENARESLAHTAYVLEETKILRKYRRFCELERDAPARAKGAWRDLRALGDQLRNRIAASGNPLVLDYVNDSLRRMVEQRRSLSHGQMMGAIGTVEQELRSSARRLQGLVGAAQSGQDMSAIERELEAAGFTGAQRCPQLHGGDHLVGWRLNFAKP